MVLLVNFIMLHHQKGIIGQFQNVTSSKRYYWSISDCYIIKKVLLVNFRMLHHPVTGLNYFVHPIMFYTTSTKFREDVKQFLFSSSKPPQMRADVEMQSNRTGDVVQQNREFKNPITEAKTN